MNEPVPPNQSDPAQLTSTSPIQTGEAEASPGGEQAGTAKSPAESLCPPAAATTAAAPPTVPPSPMPCDDQTQGVQLSQVLQQVSRLADMFDDKFRYDQVKEGIIDKLHAELQQHRNDMLGRILLPVMRDLIHLHGALLKFVEARRAFPEEKRDWNNLLDNVATFGDDLIEILARNGVESFSEDGASFNPRTQKALRTLPTQDPAADKTVAQRVRPGFRWGQQLIHNEEVIVHKLQPAVAPSGGDCPQRKET